MVVATFRDLPPAINITLMVSAFLVLALSIVFDEQIKRLLGWINVRVLQALGIADRDDERGDDR